MEEDMYQNLFTTLLLDITDKGLKHNLLSC